MLLNVRIKTLVSAQSTGIPEGLPWAIQQHQAHSPGPVDSWDTNWAAFCADVYQVLCKTNWTVRHIWASLSPSELLPRCHTNTHPSTVPGKLLGRSHLWLYTQLRTYIILFTISSSIRILACKIQSFKDFSFIGHHLFVFILFIKVRIFCSKSEHQNISLILSCNSWKLEFSTSKKQHIGTQVT